MVRWVVGVVFLLLAVAATGTEAAVPVKYYHCSPDEAPCTDIGDNTSRDRSIGDVKFTQDTALKRSDGWDEVFIHFYPKNDTSADELSMTDGCYRTKVMHTDTFYRVRWEQYASPWHCTRAGMPYGVVNLFDSPILYIKGLF